MISIIISTFNQKDYIEKWIRDLDWIYENQYKNFEVIFGFKEKWDYSNGNLFMRTCK